jgi:hypothetical protein
MKYWSLITALGLAAASVAPAAERQAVIAALEAKTLTEARAECWKFLQQHKAGDDATRQRFEAIWKDEARSLVDRVADSVALTDEQAAKLLASARDGQAAPPKELPALFRDARRPALLRANVALAYAQAFSKREMYEESLDTLRLVRPTEVIDPAAYYYHRALAEYGLLLPKEARQSITALEQDVVEAPERYLRVAGLMRHDMQSWRDRDLGAAARVMKNAGRRIEQTRVDNTTYKMQHEIVARLDELIRELEKPGSGDGDLPIPEPRRRMKKGGPNSDKPMEDSEPATNGGKGDVFEQKLRGLGDWGKLPERERAKAMQGLIRDLPPQYRQIIEDYFRALARNANGLP